jgi:flagellar basal body-associated protein FliL
MSQLKNIQQEISNELTEQINNQINQIIIEGLRLKGISFDDINDLKRFIKNHCQSATKDRQTTFFVSGIPFLVYCEDSQFRYEGDKIVGFNAGDYSFL